MNATPPVASGKKRGRPPGTGSKAQPAGSAGGPHTPPAPKQRRVAHTTAQAVLQLVSSALGLVFEPRRLHAGLEGLEQQPDVAEAGRTLDAFVRAPRTAGRKGAGKRHAAGGKSLRAASIITSLAYSQVMAAGLVDTDAVPRRLVMLAVGKAWSMWAAEAKPDKVAPYVAAAEELCAHLKQRQAAGEVFSGSIPYADEMAALMAARGKRVPDFTKHLRSRLPAAVQLVQQTAGGGGKAAAAKEAGGGSGAAARAPAPAAAPAAAPPGEHKEKKHKKEKRDKKKHKKSGHKSDRH